MTTEPPALHVQRLGKRLGGQTIIDQINFSMRPGIICGLLGPNGAGKTTLLRCITGALRPDFGRCLIHGIDSQASAAADLFGYQPDLAPMEPALRLREHLSACATLRGLPRRQRRQRCAAMLERVGLQDQAEKLVGHLSRGQHSRLALAEALLHQPRLLICDEPSAGLDPAQAIALRQLLRQLAGEHSVLLATHLLSEAHELCDELVVLVAGRVRFQGPPQAFAPDGDLESAWLSLAGAGP